MENGKYIGLTFHPCPKRKIMNDTKKMKIRLEMLHDFLQSILKIHKSSHTIVLKEQEIKDLCKFFDSFVSQLWSINNQ